MKLLTTVVPAFVALSHLGFLVLETVFWDHPVRRQTFGMTPEASASTAGVVGGLAAKTSLSFTRAMPTMIGLTPVLTARTSTAA